MLNPALGLLTKPPEAAKRRYVPLNCLYELDAPNQYVSMSKGDNDYTREELAGTTGLPDRGRECHKCGVKVPSFAEMDDELWERVIGLINNQRNPSAMLELEAKLGCSRTFAKIWVTHRGKPNPLYPGPPCPHCGGRLRRQSNVHTVFSLGIMKILNDCSWLLRRGNLIWQFKTLSG